MISITPVNSVPNVSKDSRLACVVTVTQNARKEKWDSVSIE